MYLNQVDENVDTYIYTRGNRMKST